MKKFSEILNEQKGQPIDDNWINNEKPVQTKNGNQVIITNVRHKESLMDAENSLDMVLRSIENEMSEDFYSIDLMNAYEELGTIIGEAVEDDLVNEIFSKFCTGK